MQIILPDFNVARVLVVGDLMLDRYWHGETSRISPEAPVPVVRVSGMEERPGAAANVALNIAALHGQVTLLGLCGDDTAADMLQARHVVCRFQRLRGHPTICKLRVLSRRQQLIRLDFEEPFNGAHAAALEADYRDLLGSVDVVVLSDYAKGTLAGAAGLIRAARQAGRPVLVDPKRRDFGVYAGADLLTPNLAEFETVVGPCADDAVLEARARTLMRELQLGGLLVTRGDQGVSLVPSAAPALHLPAHAREVYDVTGAGDTVIAMLAIALAAGAELAAATALANMAAGLVVGKVGTAAVTLPDLHAAMGEQQVVHQGPTAELALMHLVAGARERGERLVLTNGCFDLLHAGHVAYLRHARALGNRLIVAVNDDASVRRLKGEARPVTPLAQRMAVLAGLAAVDWVVPFSEDTPERLIQAVMPDVLVKGGDYTMEEVTGAAAVKENGGEVVILGFMDGVSTSSIVQRVRTS